MKKRRSSDQVPPIAWEYETFPIPETGGDRAFLGWVRDGWELVGIHRQAWPRPPVVAILRRERTWGRA